MRTWLVEPAEPFEPVQPAEPAERDIELPVSLVPVTSRPHHA